MTPVAEAGFIGKRLPDKSWVEQLEKLAYDKDNVPWLKLVWEPGLPEAEPIPGLPTAPAEPVQRWFLYELMPPAVWHGFIKANAARGIPDDENWELAILNACCGPDPRTQLKWDDELGRMVPDNEVSWLIWELYQETHCVAYPWWVIQGHHGGHKLSLSPTERKMAKLLGLPEEPPAPGALEYAPFDNRVLDQIRRRDRIYRRTGTLAVRQAEQQQEERDGRRLLVKWLTEQLTGELEAAPLNIYDIRRTEHDPTGDIERRIERFIETGSIYPRGG